MLLTTSTFGVLRFLHFTLKFRILTQKIGKVELFPLKRQRIDKNPGAPELEKNRDCEQFLHLYHAKTDLIDIRLLWPLSSLLGSRYRASVYFLEKIVICIIPVEPNGVKAAFCSFMPGLVAVPAETHTDDAVATRSALRSRSYTVSPAIQPR